jgi:hypothetical protein
MSELKANKISPAVGTDLTLGDSGDTINIPAGATLAGDIPAVNLIGALPAISGANLTNLPGGGKILQVQSSFDGTGAQTTTRNTWAEVGTAVTLTPASTSSTILLFSKANAFLQGGSGYALVYYSIQRTLSGTATDDVSTKSAFDFDARSSGTLFGQSETTIATFGKDSPSTTSELTYRAQYYTNAISWAGAGGVYNIDLIAMEVGV